MASSYGEDASKSALRARYLSAGASLSPRQRARFDIQVCRNLRAVPAYRFCTLLLAYVPFRDELDTASIIRRAWDEGKDVALPRCVGGERSLEFVVVDTLDGLVRGASGVMEPAEGAGDPIDPARLPESVCLVPGLVFDSRGYRIGYGAGYYDNFLATYPGTKVGLARSLQVSGNPLPVDGHDVAVDVLVSDGAVWMCR